MAVLVFSTEGLKVEAGMPVWGELRGDSFS